MFGNSARPAAAAPAAHPAEHDRHGNGGADRRVPKLQRPVHVPQKPHAAYRQLWFRELQLRVQRVRSAARRHRRPPRRHVAALRIDDARPLSHCPLIHRRVRRAAPPSRSGRDRAARRNRAPARAARCRVGLIVRHAHVIVPLDVIHVHGLGDARHLIEVAQIVRQVRIVGDAAQVAFEVAVIDRVEADERGEQPPVGLGQRVRRRDSAGATAAPRSSRAPRTRRGTPPRRLPARWRSRRDRRRC